MIIVNFCKCEKEKDVSGLWQYDYGQVLRIQGLDLPTAVEIHFSLQSKGGESLTRVGVTRDGVTDVVIPDSMLENNYTSVDYGIYAFIYLTDETSGQTEYKICMRVRSRPKPEAFDTPEDAELFREAIALVNESTESASASAASASGSATAAAESLQTTKELAQQVASNTKQVSEDTSKVTELTKKAEEFAEAAKRGVQADLSINDEENPAHVKGRTHWVEDRMVEILPETKIVIEEGQTDPALNLTYSLGLKNGEKYIVNYNGVEYKCVALDVSSTVGTEAYVLGNTGFLGLEDTGEPFMVADTPAGDNDIYGLIITEVECSFSIRHEGKVVHKLPNKFLDLEWLPVINKTEVLLAAEKTVTNHSVTPTETKGGFPDLTSSDVEGGDVLVVYFDGVRYPVTVSKVTESSFAGNLHFISDQYPTTGEPFLLNFVSTRTNVTCDDNSHTASVYALDKKVNKMPEEFLPESVDGVILRSSTEGSTKKFLLTVDDEGIPTISEITEE